MKNCYLLFPDPEAPHKCGIADLTNIGEMVPSTMTITRINIPPAYRGQGFGSQLLKMILDDADRDQVILSLEIMPSGPLGFDELENWYFRHSFHSLIAYPGIYIRYPKEP